ncbi:hypothetical protein [Oerskovia merdavium]|uniref:Uncharacterized protein n=1 Tax=Oerskovia merdavium TaxID=2762227 RepID=A0ABR8U5E0_9CELL|nr:hypothetical protein [Oerskovia merdavium]MBD7982918.1 hypothetical protein [Oerskovia merdavium]
MSGIDTTASVDPVNGVVKFPGDRYAQLTLNDQILLNLASSHVESECASAAGVHIDPLDVKPSAVYDISDLFGVWTSDVANRFAFVPPMTQADMKANGISVDRQQADDSSTRTARFYGDLTSDERAIVDECRESDDWQRFNPGNAYKPGPWTQPLADAVEDALTSGESKTVIAEYHGCLDSKGLTPDPESPFAVKGANRTVVSQEQIVLALDVVACKDETDMVQRLADVVAERQAPIITEFEAELVASRVKLDDALTSARTYLAERGVL